MKNKSIALILTAVLFCSTLSAQLPAPVPLTAGTTLEKELKRGEAHLYSVTLKKGHYTEFTVQQMGVDLHILLQNEKGDTLQTFDSPNGSEGPESVSFQASKTGKYQFLIEPLPPDVDGIPEEQQEDYLEKNQGMYSINSIQILTAKEFQKKQEAEQARWDQIKDWFGESAKPLKSVEAGNGFEDLQFLKPILKDVKIVGLGEATHGTREFFQMKHRMLEFLVKEMGYTVFVIEASYTACKNINRYVLHGEGTKEEALASQGFWTWDTEEVLDMIEWMRTYNKNVPVEKRVKFLGIDVQVLQEAATGLSGYLEEVDTTLKASFLEVREKATQYNPFQPVEDIDKLGEVEQGYNALLAAMVLHEGQLVFKSSKSAYDTALDHLRILMQEWQATKARILGQLNPEMRDFYMAENMQYLISQEPEDTRFVLWAHNGHVSAKPEGFINGGFKPLGSYLREAYGEAYYCISFAFNKGGFQAFNFDPKGERGLSGFTVEAAEERSLEWLFAANGQTISFLNLRQDLPELMKTYFAQDVFTWGIGAGFAPGSRTPQAYGHYEDYLREFDGIIFVNETSRARPSDAVKGRMSVK